MSFLAFQPQILVPLTFNVSLLSTFLFPTRISSSSYKLEMIPSIVYASWAGSALLTYRSFALLKMLSWEVLLGYHEGYGTNTWWGCRRKKKIELHIWEAILNENCEFCSLFCNGLLGFWNTHGILCILILELAILCSILSHMARTCWEKKFLSFFFETSKIELAGGTI